MDLFGNYSKLGYLAIGTFAYILVNTLLDFLMQYSKYVYSPNFLDGFNRIVYVENGKIEERRK